MGRFTEDFRVALAARLGNEQLAAKAVRLIAGGVQPEMLEELLDAKTAQETIHLLEHFEHETDDTAPPPRSPLKREYDAWVAEHAEQLADVDRRWQNRDLHRQLAQFTDALAAEQEDAAPQRFSADDALAARNRIAELKGDAAWLAKPTDPHAPGHAEANAQLGQLLELTIEPTGGVK